MADRFNDKEYIKWARAVKTRDNFICQICGLKGQETYLHSHHKDSWDIYEDKRYLLSNGCCLCKKCHNRFHSLFGWGKNHAYQLDQYKQIVEVFNLILKEKKVDDNDE